MKIEKDEIFKKLEEWKEAAIHYSKIKNEVEKLLENLDESYFTEEELNRLYSIDDEIFELL